MRRTRGVVAGLLAAAVAIGAAELVAAFVGEVASPIVAVGQAAIDLSPPPVKEFAIRTFGANDKLVLVSGIVVLLAVFAALIGVFALRERRIGYAGLVAFGAVGVAAAVTRPTSDALSALPSIVGVAAGFGALRVLLPPAAPATAVESRRRFLLSGLALGGGAAAAGVLSRFVGAATTRAVASRASLRIPKARDVPPVPPGIDLGVDGLSTFYTPNETFYRVDTAIMVPKIDANDWRLRIHGMVDRPTEMDIAQLLALPLVERDITLSCVSNEVGGHYVGNARWTGALLKPILEKAGVHPAANQLVSRSADGFTIGTPTAALMDGRDAMLAVAMNGRPLPLKHGFPVRMVVPGLYGYVSAMKWIVDMELTTFDAFHAYWVDRGWAQQAPIKTMSRIDTPRDGQHVTAGVVPIAGVAWAQHKGIARVEVEVDGGGFVPATLSAEDTLDTWRQWVFRWDAPRGKHTIRVRATDKTGYTQTSEERRPAPNGATGWHTITVRVD